MAFKNTKYNNYIIKQSFLLIKYNYILGKFIVLIVFLFSTLFKLNAILSDEEAIMA